MPVFSVVFSDEGLRLSIFERLILVERHSERSLVMPPPYPLPHTGARDIASHMVRAAAVEAQSQHGIVAIWRSASASTTMNSATASKSASTATVDGEFVGVASAADVTVA